MTRLWRGPEGDPPWARPALLLLLAATTIAYLWNLEANGWANAFYSAAAQAGSQSWTALFYGSSDAANAITVDKPPASLWVMGLSVRLFGLHPVALMAPQVLMGVASVGTLHAAVKRYWGAGAGLLAGAVLALTPVAVLMFRYTNPDALLVLLMTAAAWATMRAIERGAIRSFALVGVLIGLGFLTKALQVLLVVPFFGIAFLLAADTTLRRRILGSLVGIATMLISAGWWVAIVELVPASMRPYIGGSQHNSFLEVTFGYNGLGRLTGEETGSVGGGMGWGATGLTRMFGSSIGGQVSWLVPAALLLLVTGLWWRRRSPRSDLRRASYLVWGGWLVLTMLTFSYMSGIFHEYYTVALAPAVAALVGAGGREAWEHRHEVLGSLVLSAAVAVTTVWSFVLLGRTTEYGALRFVVIVAGLAVALLLLVGSRLPERVLALLLVVAIGVGLSGPAAYSVTTLARGNSGSIVSAGPATSGGPGGAGPGRMPGGGGSPGDVPGGGTPPGGALAGRTPPGGGQGGGSAPGGSPFGGGQPGSAPPDGGQTGDTSGGGGVGGPPGGGPAGGMSGLLNADTPDTEVVAALSEDADSYTWVAAAIGSQSAAGLQLGAQLPVMSIGGFNGSDPSPTLEQFQQYVADGRIHYFVAGGMSAGPSDTGTGAQISSWVQENFAEATIGDTTFYDLTQPVSSSTSNPATEGTTSV